MVPLCFVPSVFFPATHHARTQTRCPGGPGSLSSLGSEGLPRHRQTSASDPIGPTAQGGTFQLGEAPMSPLLPLLRHCLWGHFLENKSQEILQAKQRFCLGLETATCLKRWKEEGDTGK